CGNQARIGRLTAQTGQQFDSPDERFALAALENFLGGAIDRVHRVADGAVVFEAPLDYQPPEFSFLNYKHSSFQVIHGCTLYECKATLLWYSHRPLRCTDGSGTQISCTQGRALGKMGRRVTGACDPSHKSLLFDCRISCPGGESGVRVAGCIHPGIPGLTEVQPKHESCVRRWDGLRTSKPRLSGGRQARPS